MNYSVEIIIYFIISEYIPNFFALDYSFMMTYIKNKKNIAYISDEKEIDMTRDDNENGILVAAGK